jgi:hypothetical protein
MGTSLSSAVAVAALLQAPALPPAPDSLALARARVERDSGDAAAWLLVGRAYLRQADAARDQAPGPGAPPDSAVTRALLDTADRALVRAAALWGPLGASPAGDSARVLRVGGWERRARLAWVTAGLAAGVEAWGPLPADLRVPPVLEELGENLLRACPPAGVLVTAGDADGSAAWYMRFARGLRPDLVVVALAAWRQDAALRGRLAADLRLGRHVTADHWLSALAARRPVCVTMAFERPPEPGGRVRWTARPLLWVAGPARAGASVPPRDFVFAALRVALDQRDPWAAPALALYARAARSSVALCAPLATFRVAAEIAACRR